MNKFIFLGMLLMVFSSYSQSPAGVHGSTLWIKEKASEKGKTLDTANYFNFNPKYRPIRNNKEQYKNILSNQYSLFVVFQSEIEDEVSLITLNLGNELTEISNKKVSDIKNLEYQKVNPKKGIVLSYFVSKQDLGKKKSNLVTLENIKNWTDKTPGHDLMELIYYPRILNAIEKQKVESYLSIKYGISLLGDTDYIDSDKNKIWNYKNNATYNSRVTGVGRDDVYGLLQKQSGNSEKDGLSIGFGIIDTTNALNKSNIPNKEFLIWGDNGNSNSLKRNESETGIRKMKRIWKIQKTSIHSDTLFTQVLINKKQMILGSTNEKNTTTDESLWLAVSSESSGKFDYTSASYFLQSKEKDETVSFENILWDNDKNGADLFTFIKAPSFFVVYDIIAPNCKLAQNGKIRLKINGGQAPYSIRIESKNYSKNLTIKEDLLELSNLPSDSYQVIVTDSRARKQFDIISIAPITENDLSIASEWYRDINGEVELFPIINSESKFNFEWHLEGNIISRDKSLKVSEVGQYKLIATNLEGCSKEFLINVIDKKNLQEQNWVLHPNPTEIDMPFTLHFNLKDYSDVEISIFNMDGKLIRTKNLYTIKDIDYKDSIGLAGTYLIVVTIDGKSQATKLIVR